MGKAHAKSILEGAVGSAAELTAICDPKTESFAGFADVAAFADANELMQSGKVDAVVIATPHYSHTEFGIAALKRGLHVLVEKPISVHKKDAEKLIAAHSDKNLVFAAMFNQRTDPLYIELRKLMRNGEFGKIFRISWTITDWYRTEAYYRSGGWRATWKGEGGGILLNQSPHQLDLLQWIFGMPRKVQAFCSLGRYHAIEVEDDVTAYMEFPDGSTGTFITSTGESPGTNRLEIACDRGRVVVENGRIHWERTEVLVSEHRRTFPNAFEKPSAWQVEIPVPGDRGPQHVGILRNFVEAISQGAELIAPAGEGLHSVELGNAILYSGMTGKTVELPLDGEVYWEFLQKM